MAEVAATAVEAITRVSKILLQPRTLYHSPLKCTLNWSLPVATVRLVTAILATIVLSATAEEEVDAMLKATALVATVDEAAAAAAALDVIGELAAAADEAVAYNCQHQFHPNTSTTYSGYRSCLSRDRNELSDLHGQRSLRNGGRSTRCKHSRCNKREMSRSIPQSANPSRDPPNLALTLHLLRSVSPSLSPSALPLPPLTRMSLR